MPHSEYDDGCEFSPGKLGCLKCPLPQCRYDDPEWFRQWISYMRWRQIKERMADPMVSLLDIAAEFDISVRQLMRIKAIKKSDLNKFIGSEIHLSQPLKFHRGEYEI